MSKRAWIALAPGLFVVLWSTGFIAAKGALPFVEPFTLLLLRFLITMGLLLPLAFALRSPWPDNPALAGHIAIAGLLLHAGYLGGVFAAIDNGMPAGLVALIVGLQPLLTAAAAGVLLRETVVPRQWAGLILGFAGVALVLGEKLYGSGAALFGSFGLRAAAFAVVALLSITAGTLYQKRFCTGMDLVSGAVIQYAATAAAMGALAWGLETMAVRWTGQLVFSLAWLVLVLSVAAIALLLVLIRRGAASRVASLFYLVPPATALEAYFLFGETLGAQALAGMALTAAGVFLVFHSPRRLLPRRRPGPPHS